MAEATASGSSDGEKDTMATNEVHVDVGSESYRKYCDHYSRGCSLVSPCCGKVYPCRLCHDEQESHKIDRHAITEILCRKCSIQQPVANYCSTCGLQFGLYYFCAICNFFEDVNKGQFHCEKCGICRARGKENFFHCDKCGLCLVLGKRENHTCRPDSSKNNCPICLEDIHTSRDPAHVPLCGHVLHSTCFKGLMKKGLYQCPQCQISLVDMKQNWEKLDAERESWVMPPKLREFKVKIYCRDCKHEGDTFYHVAGLKCYDCGSYNTVRCGSEELPMVGTDFLNRHRRGDWRSRRRRSRHREERADIEKRLQAAEERALTAEQRLSDMQRQLLEVERKAEQRIQLAEQRAQDSEGAAMLALKRAQVAEDNGVELERKLYEVENELEDLMEYKELFDRTQRFSLQSEEPQELCSSDNCVDIFRQSCSSLNGFLITPDTHQASRTPTLEDERQSKCSDQLSMTSL